MGVSITPGSGKTIASDTVAGTDYQQVKLTDGTVGSTFAAVVDANGNLRVISGQPTLATYVIPGAPLAPTGLMDLFCIEAPASGVIRLQKIVIWNPGNQTTGGIVALQLLRRTSAGTGAAVTPSPMDAADAAYGGICRAGNTTVGGAGTVIDAIGLWVPAAGAAFTPVVIDYSQGDPTKAPVIPAGTANGIALKHPGAAGAANFSVSAYFTVGS